MNQNYLLIASMAFLAQTHAASAENQWSWRLVPYALAPSIDGDASLGRLDDVGLAVDPADILDVLDLGAMMYVEGMHDSGWGFILDYSFMDLSDDGTFARGRGSADAEVYQGILTASAFRRVIEDPDQSLDVYAALRWWQMDIDVDASLGPVSRSVSVREDWIDPQIGLRYKRNIGESRWSLLGQGDVGGFGVSSDFAWMAEAGVAWQARERFAIEFSYKAMGVDYETGTKGTPDYFAYDTVTHGPKIGFAFEF